MIFFDFVRTSRSEGKLESAEAQRCDCCHPDVATEFWGYECHPTVAHRLAEETKTRTRTEDKDDDLGAVEW